MRLARGMCVPVGDAYESCHADVPLSDNVVVVEPFQRLHELLCPQAMYTYEFAPTAQEENEAPNGLSLLLMDAEIVPSAVQNTLSLAAIIKCLLAPSQANKRRGVNAPAVAPPTAEVP